MSRRDGADDGALDLAAALDGGIGGARRGGDEQVVYVDRRRRAGRNGLDRERSSASSMRASVTCAVSRELV